MWMGMTVSLVGDGLYFVAIPFQVFELSNVPTALSIVGAAWTVPQVVFLLLGGVITDRVDRRWVLIGSDIVRGLAIVAIAVLSLRGSIELWHLYVLVAIYGAGEAFFMPAFAAIVPDIIPKELLTEANSVDQFVKPLALRVVGPALGGLVIAALGIGAAFIVDAGTFVVSAAAVAFIRTRREPATTDRSTSIIIEVKEGFRYVRSQSWLVAGLTAAAVGLLFWFGPWQVLLPYIIKNRLNGGAMDFGLVLAAGGVGSIVASILVSQKGMMRRPVAFVFITWGSGSLLLAGLAFVTRPWHAMVISFVMLGLLVSGQIVWATIQHQRVPRDLLGRVSSLDWLVSTSLIPVSFALTGPLAATIGARGTLVAGGLIAGAAVLILFTLYPSLRKA